jgi:PIN domain nuclease of toxin-antitoxin system
MQKAASERASASDPILLDTHAIIWLATNDKRLSRPSANLLEKAFYESRLAVSIISAWELGVLCAKKRLTITQPPQAWFNEFVTGFKVNVFDLTPEIAINSSYLPGVFHADPADRIIVATAIAHHARIMTADANILKYARSGLIKAIAC